MYYKDIYEIYGLDPYIFVHVSDDYHYPDKLYPYLQLNILSNDSSSTSY